MFSKLAVVALAALPFVAQLTLAASCTRSYTIQAGDYCDEISAAKNVSTYQLATINNGIIDSSCSNLQPNSTICLGYTDQDCSTTYVVQANDTCTAITQTAGINSTMLYANNPQINQDCSNLYIGEVLCSSKTEQHPPAVSGTSLPGEDLPWCDEL